MCVFVYQIDVCERKFEKLNRAMTEPHAGSNLQGMKTWARRDGDDFVINGSKVFISNGYIGNFKYHKYSNEIFWNYFQNTVKSRNSNNMFFTYRKKWANFKSITGFTSHSNT